MVSRSELDVLNLTAVDVQDLLASGRRTTQQMLDLYVAQILRHNNQGAKLRAVLELTPAPHLSKLAQASDRDRRNKKCPGALHGIPVIVKVSSYFHQALNFPQVQSRFSVSLSNRNVERFDNLGQHLHAVLPSAYNPRQHSLRALPRETRKPAHRKAERCRRHHSRQG